MAVEANNGFLIKNQDSKHSMWTYCFWDYRKIKLFLIYKMRLKTVLTLTELLRIKG